MATLFNNHPYTSSSGTPVGTKFTATYVGMVVETYGHVMEYISLCAWHVLFLYFVSQCINALNHPTWARFLFRNLFIYNIFAGALPTCGKQ